VPPRVPPPVVVAAAPRTAPPCVEVDAVGDEVESR
jgi:hypothetical protein